MADKSFEDLKEELKAKLEPGFVWDEDKMADLEAALKANGNDISKIDVSLYSKKGQEAPSSDNDKKKSGTTISDHDNSGDENAHEPKESDGAEAPVNDNWKEDYKNEWRQWATDNNKEFQDVQIPGSENDVQIRLFDSKEQKNKGEFAAQISYKSPHNVTLKGNNGQTPDSKYFEQTVALAMKKNGPDIEFGDIKSPEFKAKLLAACYTNGANPVNGPTEEEMSQWPKDLKDMVNAAKTKAEKGAEKTTEQRNSTETDRTSEKPEAYKTAEAAIKEIKNKGENKFDFSTLKTPEEKAVYTAALMDIMGTEIKAGKFTLDNAPSYKETAETAKKMTPEMQTAIKGGLTSYTIHSLKQIASDRIGERYKNVSKDGKGEKTSWAEIDKIKDGLTPEQIALRAARSQKRDGR